MSDPTRAKSCSNCDEDIAGELASISEGGKCYCLDCVADILREWRERESAQPDFVPFKAGESYRPAYYLPVRPNPRINSWADASDVIHAFGIDDHSLGEAVAKLLRAGKKPGESMEKDIAKVAEHVQRWLKFREEEGAPS